MKQKLRIFLQLVTLLLSSYFLLRLFFLVNNYSNFSFSSFFDLASTFVYGLRFDFAAIAAINGLFFVLFLVPVSAFYSKGYQSLLKVLFLTGNIPCFLFNFVDIAYFHFTQKRTTTDFFSVAAMGDDFKNMLPTIVRDYWLILLLFFAFCFLFAMAYNKIVVSISRPVEKQIIKIIHWILPIVGLGLIVISVRGGIQFKPLSILSAANYTSTQNVGVVLNSTFTMMKTLGKEELAEIPLLPGIKNENYFNPFRSYANTQKPFTPKNVVLIIMESFGKEYTGYFNNGKGYTPFLDSLMQNSLVCTDAFANGKKSIEGIPAIISGLPAMMNNSYIGSVYNGNKLNSLPLLLKNQGYTSAFFHGGNNGTMGFESFSHMAGYDKYVGRNEYPANKDYDGTWGIYDGPFFQFYCQQMSAMKQPFVTTFFSLSSHHPYSIPENLKNNFAEGEQPIHKAVRYSDDALRQFFNCASTQSWYTHTLFVITADHTGPSINKTYQTRSGIYAVPIVYFSPGDSLQGKYTNTTQQMDIIPSVLHYLHYKESFKFYGNSIFDSTKTHWALSYLEGIYQLITKDYVINFDGEKITSYYKRSNGALVSGSGTPSEKDSALTLLKVIISDFNHSMIHNKLTQP